MQPVITLIVVASTMLAVIGGLSFLAHHYTLNGIKRCLPSIRTTGRDLGLSRSTVKRALDDLAHADIYQMSSR